jgi:glyoxylase-like metal-dependent hydrolase (beta-lactamase superfamily II)
MCFIAVVIMLFFADAPMEKIHSNPDITAVADGLYQITLTPPLDGFTDFISAWVVSGPPSFLVDVGPGSTAEQLLAGLEVLGLARLDYLLLTHIHLDHAGAAGAVSRRFPETPIVCHAKAIPHLVDPAQLWEGSRKVLGSVAAGYGPLDPIPAERFIDARGFCAAGITALPTPGHAVHHVSYLTAAGLFAGEACGVHYRMGDGREYLRPATPPRFFMDVALASLDALIARAPARMMVGHFGAVADGLGLLNRHRDQLRFWEKWLARQVERDAAAETLEACAEGLLAQDPCLASFGAFAPPAQRRERYFLKNSINGFLGWIADSEGGISEAEGGRRKAE